VLHHRIRYPLRHADALEHRVSRLVHFPPVLFGQFRERYELIPDAGEGIVEGAASPWPEKKHWFTRRLGLDGSEQRIPRLRSKACVELLEPPASSETGWNNGLVRKSRESGTILVDPGRHRLFVLATGHGEDDRNSVLSHLLDEEDIVVVLLLGDPGSSGNVDEQVEPVARLLQQVDKGNRGLVRGHGAVQAFVQANGIDKHDRRVSEGERRIQMRLVRHSPCAAVCWPGSARQPVAQAGLAGPCRPENEHAQFHLLFLFVLVCRGMRLSPFRPLTNL